MFVEDLAAFLKETEFSVPATLPGGSVVQVIFDEPFEEIIGMESSQPTALGRSVDLFGLAHGSTITVSSRSWRVVGIQPDGTGMTRLLLGRA